MPELPDSFDLYGRQSPYHVLGVTPESSATEIRDRYNGLQRDLAESGLPATERSKEKERLDTAYNQLRAAGTRARVDFFLIDQQLGVKQCETIAGGLAKPNTDVKGIIKPRQIRVTHATLLDELDTFVTEPGKVIGLHPRPMEIDEPFTLPEPLAVQFDC